MGRNKDDRGAVFTAINCWNNGQVEQAVWILARAGLTDIDASAPRHVMVAEISRVTGHSLVPSTKRTAAFVSLAKVVSWTPSGGAGALSCPGCREAGIRISETRVDTDGVRILFICGGCSKGFALAVRKKGDALWLVGEPEFPEVLQERAVPKPLTADLRMDPQRNFSSAQKQEIYLRCNGHCQGCAQPLDSDWHADHIVPHSRGGRTEIVNGQALCQPCNNRKRAKVLTVDGGEQ